MLAFVHHRLHAQQFRYRIKVLIKSPEMTAAKAPASQTTSINKTVKRAQHISSPRCQSAGVMLFTEHDVHKG